MSLILVSESSVPARTSNIPNVNRPYANYNPSIWGDHFLSSGSDFTELNNKKEHQRLKEEVKKMLKNNKDKSSHKLELVDVIQRLGVSYHFKNEIEEILKEIIDNSCSHDICDEGDSDLYIISLKFRLLRQQGYKMSCDVFKLFKDSEGKFKETLIDDAEGMLSLYEASHLMVHGEDVLDEALSFTTTHLKSFIATTTDDHLDSNPLLLSQIRHALKQPLHKGLTRLEARHYFSSYEQDASHNQVLLAFAKLDFNLLQKLHQKELCEISKWWKELDFSKKLPFARDRIVECYFWILGVYFEPEYVLARRMLTKVIAMTSVVDDIYDAYGTPQELDIFTAAIERWDISAMDQLPEYMQIYYKALLDVYTEIEENMPNEGTSYRVFYAKKAMKDLVRAYFLESKWLHQQYIPTMEEYMPLALATSGYKMLTCSSFVGMGNLVTKDSFEWLAKEPKIVIASSIICRLMDDIVSHKFEQKRGHVASSIECYMRQHEATEEEAVEEMRKQVRDAWKDINEECLYPTEVPMPLLIRVLNLARVMDVVYKDEDGYTNVGSDLKKSVSSLLIDPVPM